MTTTHTASSGAPAHPASGRLSDYLDGGLSPEARERIDAHLAACESCAATLAALRAVVAIAQGADEGPEPPPGLWRGIAPRLTPRRVAWWRRAAGLDGGSWLPRGVVAVVAVASLIGAVWIARHRDRPPAALSSTPVTTAAIVAPGDPAYDDAVADLLGVLRTRLTHDPQVLAVLEQNIEAIDVAIADYRDLLSAQPADQRLQARVATARERKLEILKRAAALAEVTN